MKTLKKLLFYVVLPVFFITSCDENPVKPIEPIGPSWPSQLSIVEPSADETYWTDLSVPCKSNASDELSDQLVWRINGKTVDCNDGTLSFSFEEGEYEVTVQRKDKETENDKVIVKVMEEFSVEIVSPKDGSIFFTGDEILCLVKITPDKYQGEVSWKVSNQEIDCSNGFVINETGEYDISTAVTIEGRTETDVVKTEVLPVITGKVYPFTSTGVVSTNGLEVSLSVQGDNSNDSMVSSNITSDGDFIIKTELVKEFGPDEVRVQVTGNSDFYSSVADLSGSDLLDLVEKGELSFILPPKHWIIPSGKLQGNSTSIKLEDAFESDVTDRDFYGHFSTILAHNRPIKTAISRKYHKEITPQDSVNLWKNKFRFLEEYLGLGELFTPANESEVPTTQDGFLISFDNPDRIGSAAKFIIDGNLERIKESIIGGWIEFSFIEHVESISVHEPIHMIGFGHTCKWNSIMNNGTGCMNGSRDPSIEDVSYIQLAYLVRDFQYEKRIHFGLEEAYKAL